MKIKLEVLQKSNSILKKGISEFIWDIEHT